MNNATDAMLYPKYTIRHGKKRFLLLVASGILGLIFPALGVCNPNIEEALLDPTNLFGILPSEWFRQPKNNRWTNYGAQPKTADEVRQEKVLATVNAAHQLISQGKHSEALAKLRELDAVAGKKPDDTYLIERTRLAIASRIGDQALLLQTAQAVVTTGRASSTEQLSLEDFLARAFYNQKNYAQAIPWLVRYAKEGGADVNLRDALARAYYFSNDYGQAAGQARTTVEAEEKAGKAPTENLFKFWMRATFKLNDPAQYLTALEKTVAYYPRKEYWSELLNCLVSRPSFSDELSFDAYRFMYATGQITSADDYVGMADSALLSGYAALAQQVLERGFQTGVLGHGPDAALHRQLRDAAIGNAAIQAKKLGREAAAAAHDKTGDRLVSIGDRYVDQGEADKGIGLIAQGIQIGNLKNPDEARLHLGIAYAAANRLQDALQAWQQVQGNNGSAELARYWRLYLEGKDRSTASGKT